MESDDARLFEWIKAKGIVVPMEWAEQCIQFVKEILEEANLPFTFENVSEKAYEQWTLADLRDLQEPVFPRHLATAHRIVLTNVYCVQVNSIVDVSVSAYSQYQKCSAADGDNTEIDTEAEEQAKPWEPKPTRMLSMELTDGLITVKAIEDRPIPALRPDLSPGFKIRLHGRIESRKGVLFLGPENVDVLGGNVESLLEENSLGNVLKRKLSAIGNGVPATVQAATTQVNAVQPMVTQVQLAASPVRAQPRVTSMVSPVQLEDSPIRSYVSPVRVQQRVTPVQLEGSPVRSYVSQVRSHTSQVRSYASPLRVQPTVTSMVTPVRSYASQVRSNASPVREDYFDPIQSEPSPNQFHFSPIQLSPVYSEDNATSSVVSTSIPLSNNSSVSVEYDDNMGISMKIVEKSVPFWAEPTPTSPSYPRPPVFTTLKDKLANMQFAPGSTVATVRGLILGIGQKLSVNGGRKWSIAVVVNDGTMMVHCDIDNDLITRLLNGYTALDAYNAKKKVPPDAKELLAIEKAMEHMHNFLSTFDGLIQLEFCPSPLVQSPNVSKQRPVIKNFRQFNDSDLARLRTQVMKEC